MRSTWKQADFQIPLQWTASDPFLVSLVSYHPAPLWYCGQMGLTVATGRVSCLGQQVLQHTGLLDAMPPSGCIRVQGTLLLAVTQNHGMSKCHKKIGPPPQHHHRQRDNRRIVELIKRCAAIVSTYTPSEPLLQRGFSTRWNQVQTEGVLMGYMIDLAGEGG